MLYITEKIGTNDHKNTTYHAAVDKKLSKMFIDCKSVVEVRASGNELVKIRATFLGIPDVVGKEEMRWFGADAAFIVANLE